MLAQMVRMVSLALALHSGNCNVDQVDNGVAAIECNAGVVMVPAGNMVEGQSIGGGVTSSVPELALTTDIKL